MTRSKITEWIADLRAGRMSLYELASRFQRLDWIAARRPAPETPADMARQEDVEADVPGSFDEVTAAYDRGDLTSEEYRVLSAAVADAIDASIRAFETRATVTGAAETGGTAST